MATPKELTKKWGVSITDSAAGFYPALWGFDSLTPRHFGSMVKGISRGTSNPLFLVRIQVDPPFRHYSSVGRASVSYTLGHLFESS